MEDPNPRELLALGAPHEGQLNVGMEVDRHRAVSSL